MTGNTVSPAELRSRAEARGSEPRRGGEAAPATKPAHRGPLPERLPRSEAVLDVPGQTCPCCCGALHAAGESVSEMLDWVPAQVRVLRVRRPKWACTGCGTLHQTPAPERPIAKGLATPALLAHVLVGRYCDHLPLYRQAQMFARHGVELSRSTLSDWVGGACWWLEPLHERLAAHVLAGARVFADDTPLPALDPGRGRTKTGRLWAYARDDRPWAGPDPPAVVFHYAPDRTAARPAEHLAGFAGVVQADGYAGFEHLTRGGRVTLAACWAHVRRRFYELHEATASPIAGEALRRIGRLYEIEADVRGRPAEERRAARERRTRPLVDALRAWLEAQLARVPARGKLAEAIRYALGRWAGLTRFLDDGRIDLDTNPVERAIRPVALGRKAWLFAGSDRGGRRAAAMYSLVVTAKLNGVDPRAWLADVLARIDDHPASKLHELLPWNWVKRPGDTAQTA